MDANNPLEKNVADHSAPWETVSLGNRNRRIAGRKQISGNLRANSGPVCRKFMEIWLDLPFSQLIQAEADRGSNHVYSQWIQCTRQLSMASWIFSSEAP